METKIYAIKQIRYFADGSRTEILSEFPSLEAATDRVNHFIREPYELEPYEIRRPRMRVVLSKKN